MKLGSFRNFSFYFRRKSIKLRYVRIAIPARRRQNRVDKAKLKEKDSIVRRGSFHLRSPFPCGKGLGVRSISN